MKQCPTCNKQYKNLQEHITKSHSEKHEYVIKYQYSIIDKYYAQIVADIYKDGELIATVSDNDLDPWFNHEGSSSWRVDLPITYTNSQESGFYCLLVELRDENMDFVKSSIGRYWIRSDTDLDLDPTPIRKCAVGSFKIIDPKPTA